MDWLQNWLWISLNWKRCALQFFDCKLCEGPCSVINMSDVPELLLPGWRHEAQDSQKPWKTRRGWRGGRTWNCMEEPKSSKIHQNPSRSIHAFYMLCSFVLRLRTSSAMAPSPFQLWNFSLSSNSRKIERERHRETEHSKTERRRSKSNDNHARIVFWNLSIKYDQMKPCTTRHNISTLW